MTVFVGTLKSWLQNISCPKQHTYTIIRLKYKVFYSCRIGTCTKVTSKTYLEVHAMHSTFTYCNSMRYMTNKTW